MNLRVILLVLAGLSLASCTGTTLPTATVTIPTVSYEPTSTLTPETSLPVWDGISTTTSHAPGAQWVAETVLSPSAPGHIHVRFRVARTDGTVEWDIVNEERQDGLGFPSPAVLHWLPEEQRLFYTEASLPGGCPRAPYHTGLFEVGLTDGRVTRLSDVEGYLAVSPAADQIAYRPGGPMHRDNLIPDDWQLVLFNLETDDQRPVFLELDETMRIVNFVWSPDATSLLLVVTASVNCPALGHSVLLVDLENEKR